MNSQYAKWRQTLCNGGANLSAGNIVSLAVTSGYSPDLNNHQYISDLGSNVLGAYGAWTFSSDVNGVLKVAGPAVLANVPSGVITYYVHAINTGATSTSPLIGITDGTFTVTCAVSASTSATTVQVDPLGYSVAGGVTFSLGGVSVTTASPGSATTTAQANAGATSVSVSALGASYPSGTVFLYNGTPAATLSASASSGATSLAVSALPAMLPSGATLNAAAGSIGQRTLYVSALPSGVSQNGTGSAPIAGCGLPMTSTGTNFSVTLNPDAIYGLLSI